MVAPPCPDRSRLAGYLLGNVSAQELESISVHLDTCAVCGSTAEELESAADPRVEGLRKLFEEWERLQSLEEDHETPHRRHGGVIWDATIVVRGERVHSGMHLLLTPAASHCCRHAKDSHLT